MSPPFIPEVDQEGRQNFPPFTPKVTLRIRNIALRYSMSLCQMVFLSHPHKLNCFAYIFIYVRHFQVILQYLRLPASQSSFQLLHSLKSHTPKTIIETILKHHSNKHLNNKVIQSNKVLPWGGMCIMGQLVSLKRLFE